MTKDIGPESLTAAEATAVFRQYLLGLRAQVMQGNMSVPAAKHLAATEWNRLAARVPEPPQTGQDSPAMKRSPSHLGHVGATYSGVVGLAVRRS